MNTGIRVSREGYDVNKSKKHQMVFDSDSPVLRIHKIIDANIHFNSEFGYYESFINELGYIPIFTSMVMLPDGTYRKSDQINPWIEAYEDKIVVQASLSDGESYKMRIIVFENPLINEIDSDISGSGTEARKRSDGYGIKISKEGSDINSENPNDFLVNTNFKSMVIHKQGYIDRFFTTYDGMFGYDGMPESPAIHHGLGYRPAVLWFNIPSDDLLSSSGLLKYAKPYNYYEGIGATIPVIDANEQDIYIRENNWGRYYYVIFREPL